MLEVEHELVEQRPYEGDRAGRNSGTARGEMIPHCDLTRRRRTPGKLSVAMSTRQAQMHVTCTERSGPPL